MTRSAALASALERAGVRTLLLVPHGFERLAAELGARRILALLECDASTLRARIERGVRDFGASDFIVDTFPEGILGELGRAHLGTLRRVVLLRLRRDANEAHFRAALASYSVCIDLESHLEWLAAGESASVTRFGPVVRELRASAQGSAAPDALIVAVEPAQRSFLERLAARLRSAGLRIALATEQARTLGASELRARVVVAPAGYNLSYELCRLRTWHVALPAARRFDDQRRRAEALTGICSSPEAVERRVLALHAHADRRSSPCRVRRIADLAEHVLGAVEVKGSSWASSRFPA